MYVTLLHQRDAGSSVLTENSKLAARDVLPPSTYELSHFDVISHQLLDSATDELRKRFTDAPYSTALAISWAPREFLYRAWRTGRRSRSMKRREQGSDCHEHPTKAIDVAMIRKHSNSSSPPSQSSVSPKSVSSKEDWLSVVLRHSTVSLLHPNMDCTNCPSAI